MAAKKATIAKFVCWVDDSASNADLVNDLKAYTWETFREHALLKIRASRRIIAAGGAYGIRFKLRESGLADPFGSRIVYAAIDVEGQPLRIDSIISHTHPKPTGPSSSDFEMLEVLGQKSSILYEIGGADPKGTVFWRKGVAHES